jgi:hypothetical protein
MNPLRSLRETQAKRPQAKRPNTTNQNPLRPLHETQAKRQQICASVANPKRSDPKRSPNRLKQSKKKAAPKGAAFKYNSKNDYRFTTRKVAVSNPCVTTTL